MKIRVINEKKYIETIYTIITGSQFLDYTSYMDELAHLNYLAKNIVSSSLQDHTASMFINKIFLEGTSNKNIFIKKMNKIFRSYNTPFKIQILNVKNDRGIHKYNAIIKFENLFNENNTPNYNLIHSIIQDILDVNVAIFICNNKFLEDVNKLDNLNNSIDELYNLSEIPLIIKMINDDIGTSLYCKYN